jgi:P-type Ca2+ transporter type 2C
MAKEGGLSSKEAKDLLNKYGKNVIEDTGKIHPLKILFRQIKSNFVIYILVFAMLLSFIVGEEKIITGYVILGIIIIIITVGFVQEFKAEQAIQALKNMIMPVSIVIRDGREIEVNSSDIVPGDIIILRNGEKIPADCVVIQQNNLQVNESILTGESKEIEKVATKVMRGYKDENLIFMGTFVVNGKCMARVVHTGMHTRFGKIAKMISTAEKELPLQKKVNKIAKYMSIFGALFSVITGMIMFYRGDTFVGVLLMVIAMCVASFPEGFPVVLIASLASGARRMAKKNAIVNRMSIIETLGETTVICSDKTGTITKGEMTVKNIFSDNRIIDVTGTGYEGQGDFLYKNKKIKIEKSAELLMRSAVLCNDSRIFRVGEDHLYRIQGAPTEAALLIMGAKNNFFREDLNYERIEEVPFSSERKMMTVLIKEPKGSVVYSKGALEILLKRCKYIQRDNGVFRLLERDRERILELNSKFANDALRTLAFAYKKGECSSKNCMEEDLIFLGFVAMEDPPRPEIKEALLTCKNAGIKVKMITGDNKKTAISISKQIGLDPGRVMEGVDIDKLSDEELKKLVKHVVIFARVKPEHKLRIVRALKANGEIVTMTGDGVNDAPALKEAHIGVAMGINGTDVSRSVADLTLKDDNFATIVDAIKEGRTIFTNIQKFSSYQISVNFAQVGILFFATLLGFPKPLVAIQILFMNIFSDEITALTLIANPYSKDVMELKPRRKSNIVTKPLFIMIVVCGLVMSIGSLLIFNYVLLPDQSNYMEAKTVAFVAMSLFAVANAYNFRSFRKITLLRSPFTNKYLFYGSIFVVASTLMLIYSPLHYFLETVSVHYEFVFFSLLVALSIVIIMDIVKIANERLGFWSEDMQDFKRNKRIVAITDIAKDMSIIQKKKKRSLAVKS